MNAARTLDLFEFRRYQGGTVLYSNPDLNSVLGAAEVVILHLVISDSSGSPDLRILADDSPDNENWSEISADEVIEASGSLPGTYRGVLEAYHGRFLRFRVVDLGSGNSVTFTVRASLKNR